MYAGGPGALSSREALRAADGRARPRPLLLTGSPQFPAPRRAMLEPVARVHRSTRMATRFFSAGKGRPTTRIKRSPRHYVKREPGGSCASHETMPATATASARASWFSKYWTAKRLQGANAVRLMGLRCKAPQPVRGGDRAIAEITDSKALSILVGHRDVDVAGRRTAPTETPVPRIAADPRRRHLRSPSVRALPVAIARALRSSSTTARAHVEHRKEFLVANCRRSAVWQTAVCTCGREPAGVLTLKVAPSPAPRIRTRMVPPVPAPRGAGPIASPSPRARGAWRPVPVLPG